MFSFLTALILAAAAALTVYIFVLYFQGVIERRRNARRAYSAVMLPQNYTDEAHAAWINAR